MKKRWDVIVIGAGPAGLCTASTAAGYGLDVVVLDEQPALGGQIYRNVERVSSGVRHLLGADYSRGMILARQFRQTPAAHVHSAIVWQVDADGRVCFSRNGQSRQIQGRHIVIATGAMERPVPFEGWTLPGVMGAGAADANFKSSGLIPDGPVVLAGSGPLLMLIAGHLDGLGAEVQAILDTTPVSNMMSALPHLPMAFRRTDYLFKGMALLLKSRCASAAYIRGVTGYAARGNRRLDRVFWRVGKKTGTIKARALLVHEGVIPRCDLTRQLRLEHDWDPVQRCWFPNVNRWGRTSLPKIHVAGDGAFVHGGVAAEIKGGLAAIDIAADLDVSAPGCRGGVSPARLRQRLYAELSPRPFVDRLYRPRPGLYNVSRETLVCRCEAVTAGDIHQALAEGCRDPNELKTMSRCGMGPCQGRMCGTALSEIMAEGMGVHPRDLAPLRVRPPVRNIALGELAQLSLLEETQPQ